MAEFIVTLNETVDATAVARALAEHGCTITQMLDELHMIVIECNRALISRLELQPGVMAIEESVEMRTPE